MKRWLMIFLALVMLGAFSYGCVGVQKDAQIKCPKCGAVFTVDEGLAQVQMFQGTSGGPSGGGTGGVK